ncbi:DJ-1/PfpI/YhbO family deglycase/protease [Cellulomonas phragmiteti]|uniref:Protease n=1 Tax=Cellulomonas phragmiteti TaxID=478780 RepID=A0ABQ4DQ54_9CELL|nr:type 1 glutamine amidotransferase domain-containing protein [Cellulomonas phragmiteti]GIG41459.1 protease [Cellulomonas phragmiteti]
MSDADLRRRRVLAVVTNYGVEQDELVVPVEHLREDGATVDVAAVDDAPIETLVGDKDPGRTVQPTTTVSAVDPDAYDLLLIPGGTLNADNLRLQDEVVQLAKTFASSGRPVAAICHGPWLLVEAGLVEGKRLTSYPSLTTDVRNAGGTWVDEEVVTDDTHGFRLVTSRTPDDLEAFLREVDAALTA